MKNRVKCSLDPIQVEERLRHQPDILEFYLQEDDVFGDKLNHLTNMIDYVQKQGVKVYLHHPIKYRGAYVDILHEEVEYREYYLLSTRILHRICLTYGIKCVLHCYSQDTYSANYMDKTHTEELKAAIEPILAWGGDVFMWENVITGLFTFHNPYLLDVIVKPLQLPLVHDISHTFIGVQGDNNALAAITKQFDPYVCYLHVVDSLGEKHDGLELGTGRIDWEPLFPYIETKDFIYEVMLEDNEDATPMVRSRDYLAQFKR